jgi:hypothetical protein
MLRKSTQSLPFIIGTLMLVASALMSRNQLYCTMCQLLLDLTEALRDKGFTTMETIRHLGLELGVVMKTTIKETLKIDLKAVR